MRLLAQDVKVLTTSIKYALTLSEGVCARLNQSPFAPKNLLSCHGTIPEGEEGDPRVCLCHCGTYAAEGHNVTYLPSFPQALIYTLSFPRKPRNHFSMSDVKWKLSWI